VALVTRRIPTGRRAVVVETYQPAGAGPWPGVLLLHELIGLTDHVRADATELADRGYLTWCPDLFTGGAASYCIRRFFTPAGLGNHDDAQVREVGTLLDALKADPGCDRRLGMIGMCMTGGFVLHMARRDDLSAPVVYHHAPGITGAGISAADAAEIRGPVQGHFAADDRICPKRRADQLKATLGARLDLHVHPDAGHGLRSRFRSTAAGAEAWRETLAFLDRQLGARPAAVC
jgi:carboxymethylenebutenolidase